VTYKKVQWFLFEMTAWIFALMSKHLFNNICMGASTYVKYSKTFSRIENFRNIQTNIRINFKYTFNSTMVICRFPMYGTPDAACQCKQAETKKSLKNSSFFGNGY
jgi:hypothetical protein